MRRVLLAALGVAGFVGLAGQASADTFVLTNTSIQNCQYDPTYCAYATGNGYVTQNADGSTTLVGSDSGNPGTTPAQAQVLDGMFETTSYIATALQNESLVFDFVFHDEDTYGSCYDEPFKVVDGQEVAVLCQNLPQPVFGTNLPEDGSVTFNLSAGDTYGFAIYSDSSQGPGTFTFKLASATFPEGGGGVPEPSAWAMMILGLGWVGAALRRRQLKDVISSPVS